MLTPKNKINGHFRSDQRTSPKKSMDTWTSSWYRWSVSNAAWYASSIWDQQHILIKPPKNNTLPLKTKGFQRTHCHPAYWFWIRGTKVNAQDMSNRKNSEQNLPPTRPASISKINAPEPVQCIWVFSKVPTCALIFRGSSDMCINVWGKLPTCASIFRGSSNMCIFFCGRSQHVLRHFWWSFQPVNIDIFFWGISCSSLF